MTAGAGEGAAAGACPKCGRARPAGAEACARCGLVFARWTPEAAAAAAAPLDGEGERLWAAAREAWQDEARHDAFVKHCSRAGQLAAAGRLYRGRLDADAGDAVATRMQKRIIAMASVALEPVRAQRAPVTRSRWFWIVVGLGVVGGALAGVLASARR